MQTQGQCVARALVTSQAEMSVAVDALKPEDISVNLYARMSVAVKEQSAGSS